ncbi:MAG TPA: glycogen-debranching protein [Parachlamydiales bacterium]|nr:glycogen-debranching protein [Parachlamydiales bacterium]
MAISFLKKTKTPHFNMKKSTGIYNGTPSPLGCSSKNNRTNFAVFSEHASQMFLGLFDPKNPDFLQEYPLIRTGSVWHIALDDLDRSLSYAFRAEGPCNQIELYHKEKWLADPYAKTIDSSLDWNSSLSRSSPPSVRAPLAIPPPFDWQGVEPPLVPDEQLIIYEAHVRGFTQHPSSKTAQPGTFLGFIEKIPYLKKLGVNAIELMPIFEFDETHCKNIDPSSHQPLPNYWGYNPLHFFAPMRRYAKSDPINECKTMIRELHRHGFLVFLDVVYNHTGEGKEKDYIVHFKGLDNEIYYQVLSSGEYRDATGCGHTVNANHPQVQKLIIDSLRYWAQEMKIDGFRFDLCAALTRGLDGQPMKHAPLIAEIASDPLLSKKKLIAEAWDASRLYLLGHFSNQGPWHEWNGQYRDHVRRFLKGTEHYAGSFATALCGSEPLYGPSNTPLSSINFITSHDGYSLRDLVSYQKKHNLSNGENNHDGSNQNDSWNCGFEGRCQDPSIEELREKQMRNFLLALFLSQGIPMLLMGDEYGHTRLGNNNPYVQDNEINWFLWDQPRSDIVAFTAALIDFRKKHSDFHRKRFLSDQDISWHGLKPHAPDWSPSSRFVAFSFPNFYIAFNAHPTSASVELPKGPWHPLVDTTIDWQNQPLLQPERAAAPLPQTITMQPYSALLLRR